jgi:peptidoglycan/xylan/chitin deacetylase (PgdA/CDA1 family)
MRDTQGAHGTAARLALLIALALMATAAVAQEQAPADTEAVNVLPNGGFEEGMEPWWIKETASDIVADAAHTGKMGLRAGADRYLSMGAQVECAHFAVTPGQELTLKFWARTKTGNGGVFLQFFDAANKMLSDPALKSSGGSPVCIASKTDGEWHDYTLTAKAPEGAAQTMIWVHTWSGAGGYIDFDDFTLTGLPADARPLPSPRRRKPEKAPDVMPARSKPPIMILKLDDLMQQNGKVPEPWKRVADYLGSRNIKCGMGVICKTLQDATPDYVDWIKQHRDSGMIEFWFHGWDHGAHPVDGVSYPEYSHRSFEEQKQHTDDSQRLAQEKLGFTFRTFGPPGGGTGQTFDAETLKVMAADPYIQIMLYPQPLDAPGKALNDAGKVTILDRVWDVNLESAVGMPDLERLRLGFSKHPDRKYFVLQGHAAMWTPDRFAEFQRIIDFLVEQRAVFMTPSEYVDMKQKEAAAKQ